MKKFVVLAAFLLFWGSPLWAGPVPLLAITPSEIDLGIIRPDKVSHASVILTKVGDGDLVWEMEDPAAGLRLAPRRLQGRMQASAQEIVVAIKYGKTPQNVATDGGSLSDKTLQLMILRGDENVLYILPGHLGSGRILLPFRSEQGLQQVVVRYEVLEQEEPLLNVEPSELDFGLVDSGRNPTTQLKITNKGIKLLHWKVSIPAPLQNRGRLISLRNNDVRGSGGYLLPAPLNRDFQISGAWEERDGLPASSDPERILTLGFSGNAVAVAVRKGPEGGILTVALDDMPAGQIDCRSEKAETAEYPVGGPLLEGVHILRLSASAGEVVLAGLRIRAKDILSGPSGWIKIFPDIGDTMSEVDFANVSVLTDRLEPGNYAATLLVSSDGGDVPVDLWVRVSTSSTTKILPVYQYLRGMDYLLTTAPERENQTILAYYQRQGIAFRLFRDGTPGTRRLLRWYHAGKGDHYYTAEGDPNAKSVIGYIAEGSIGNIASSRLPGTRELYRWFNAKTGLHAYTLDGHGGGLNKKGYVFDGIVGYVR